MPWDYLLVAGIVFAVNLLPAFGPPTSAVLVALTLSFDLASVPLIASGAVAAACGRYVLASGARRVRPTDFILLLSWLPLRHWLDLSARRTSQGGTAARRPPQEVVRPQKPRRSR